MSYRAVIWLGLGTAACGLVVSLVAANAEPAYGGPMTGLGPALLMLAGFGMIGLGGLVALVAFAFGLSAGPRQGADEGEDGAS